ncbi:MAG: response regulator [Chitinivibrionales bacterium]|nr:response regulator [Chitinivibrionales bacterium]
MPNNTSVHRAVEPLNSERSRAMLRPVVWLLAGPGFVYGLVIMIFWFSGRIPAIGGIIGIAIQVLCIASFWFSRSKNSRIASYLIVLALYLVMYGGNCYLGVSHSMLVGYAMVAILAGILIDMLAALFFTLVSIGTYLLIITARNAGVLPAASSPGSSIIAEPLAISLGLIILGAVLLLYNRQMARMAARDKKMSRELEQANVLLKRELAEKQKAEQTVTSWLEMEKAVSAISARFVGALADIENTFTVTLKDIASLSKARRVYLVLLGHNAVIEKLYEYQPENPPDQDTVSFYPVTNIISFAARWLDDGTCRHIPDIAAIPGLSEAERNTLQQSHVESILFMPLFIQQELAGFIGCDNPGCRVEWEEDDIAVFKVISEIIGNALLRKKLEDQFYHSQKMEAVGRLAGGMAHDFNNILTAIMGYAELLSRKVASDTECSEDVEEIKKAGKRAATLIFQLMAFSRKQVVNPQQLDLNELLESMKKMLSRLLSEEIRIETQFDPDLKPVKADPVQIEQIVMNLAVNARDAMPRGGTLHIATKNIRITTKRIGKADEIAPGDYVQLTIADTGAGMSDYVVSHLFEPFFTTKQTGKGTGLGLATVYGIVKQHGGHIQVTSSPGKGSIFRIYLPQYIHEENAGRSDASAEQNFDGSEVLLVVEDNDQVKNLICSSFEQYHYTVISASDPAEAIELCEQFSGTIDCIITDVVMPEMSGHELAQLLKKKYPRMKILYISGYTSSDTVAIQRGVMSPGTYFLQKPFTPATLVKKVREILDKQ